MSRLREFAGGPTEGAHLKVVAAMEATNTLMAGLGRGAVGERGLFGREGLDHPERVRAVRLVERSQVRVWA